MKYHMKRSKHGKVSHRVLIGVYVVKCALLPTMVPLLASQGSSGMK